MNCGYKIIKIKHKKIITKKILNIISKKEIYQIF